jgi:hypothetical protein
MGNHGSRADLTYWSLSKSFAFPEDPASLRISRPNHGTRRPGLLDSVAPCPGSG